MAVAVGNKVKVQYTGTFDDGEIFDSSPENEPLEFKTGANQVIPGFDQAVQAMTVGETKKVRIAAKDAYGTYNPEMVFKTDPSQFSDETLPVVGQQFRTKGAEGQPLFLTVKSISEGEIEMDANHPLAGKDLNFDLELIEVL